MRTHSYHYLGFCLTLLLVMIAEDASAQVQSKSLSGKGKSIGYLEPKIIEMDPILKLAKETVPFDRAFFLKIKRKSTGKSKEKVGLQKTVVDTVKAVVRGDSTFKYNKQHYFEKEIKSGEESPPSAIKSIKLSRLDKRLVLAESKTLFLGNEYEFKIETSDVFQESEKSKFLFIKIPNLTPNQRYELQIEWEGEDTPEAYYFSTVNATLEGRAKQRLSPQLGVTTGVFKSGDNVDIEPSLLFAVYYNIRAIDPDIPTGSYDFWAPQRFSLMLGVSLNSLAIPNVRADLIGNSNLLFGVGYQTFDGVRFSAGGLFFNELNPNRLLAEEKSTESTLYMSATVNLKLKDLLGGVITTLGF